MITITNFLRPAWLFLPNKWTPKKVMDSEEKTHITKIISAPYYCYKQFSVPDRSDVVFRPAYKDIEDICEYLQPFMSTTNAIKWAKRSLKSGQLAKKIASQPLITAESRTTERFCDSLLSDEVDEIAYLVTTAKLSSEDAFLTVIQDIKMREKMENVWLADAIKEN